MDRYLESALRLHGYLLEEHWNGEVVAGPDPGIRFNARAGRFLKSYLPFIAWQDSLTYVQAQGYWISNNWILHKITGRDDYRELAVAGSEGVLARQHPEGYWPYPNPEWAGRIATVEGCFGALGLVDTYENTGDARFLEGALAWHAYMKHGIGFRTQEDTGMLAVNYFAHVVDDVGGVPNNSTLVLWLLARLFEVTQNDVYLEHAAPLARWLAHVQVDTGELPYFVGNATKPDKRHFLCHQYNAFEFMDLAHYYRITDDESVLPMMERLARYLSGGFADKGYARYDCMNDSVEVLYYTTALAQALSQASDLGFGDHSLQVAAAYDRTLGEQREDGSFRYHSRGNYRVLRDRRPYPRYLLMILHHLLLAHQTAAGER